MTIVWGSLHALGRAYVGKGMTMSFQYVEVRLWAAAGVLAVAARQQCMLAVCLWVHMRLCLPVWCTCDVV